MAKRLKLKPRNKSMINQLSPIEILRLVPNYVERADNVRRMVINTRGPINYSDDPVVIQRDYIKGRRWLPAIGCLGYMLGFAAVYETSDRTRARLVGRESSLELWKLLGRPFVLACNDPLSHGLREQLLGDIQVLDNLPRVTEETRQGRVALDRIKDKLWEIDDGGQTIVGVTQSPAALADLWKKYS